MDNILLFIIAFIVVVFCIGVVVITLCNMIDQAKENSYKNKR